MREAALPTPRAAGIPPSRGGQRLSTPGAKGCDQTLSPPNDESGMAESPSVFRNSFGKAWWGEPSRRAELCPPIIAAHPEDSPHPLQPEIKTKACKSRPGFSRQGADKTLRSLAPSVTMAWAQAAARRDGSPHHSLSSAPWCGPPGGRLLRSMATGVGPPVGPTSGGARRPAAPHPCPVYAFFGAASFMTARTATMSTMATGRAAFQLPRNGAIA